MTREIKFRVYTEIRNEVLGMDYFDLRNSSSRVNDTVMQFTGMVCNGYDWYEGDILENDGDWYKITWDNDQLRWEATGIKSTGESLALSELLSQETWVQGNIYESPELLHV